MMRETKIPMQFTKRTLLCLLMLGIAGSGFSQVEIDQSIQLTGGVGQSAITGLEDPPVNGTDAVNKDYVDGAVAASGGSCYPTEITNELDATNNPCSGTGCGTNRFPRLCLDACNSLTYNSNNDWRVPEFEELLNLYSIAPGNTSTNLIWSASFGGGTKIAVYRYSNGDVSQADDTDQFRCRCVR